MELECVIIRIDLTPKAIKRMIGAASSSIATQLSDL